MFRNFMLLVLVAMLGACATTGTTLARGASPVPVLFQDVDVCTAHMVSVGLTPDAALKGCLDARGQEKDRAIATANAAAKAVQYPAYNGSNWQGAGYYGQTYYQTQPYYGGGCQGCGTYQPYRRP